MTHPKKDRPWAVLFLYLTTGLRAIRLTPAPFLLGAVVLAVFAFELPLFIVSYQTEVRLLQKLRLTDRLAVYASADLEQRELDALGRRLR